MTWLDAIIAGILVANVVAGYLSGFLRRAIVFIGLFAGVGFATAASPQLAASVMKSFGAEQALWVHLGVYLACVTGAVILFEGLGAVYSRWLNAYFSLLFDRLTGSLGGAVLGAAEVSLLLILGVSLLQTNLPNGYPYPSNFATVQQTFEDSALASRFYGLQPLTRMVFTAVLPADLRAYFTKTL